MIIHFFIIFRFELAIEGYKSLLSKGRASPVPSGSISKMEPADEVNRNQSSPQDKMGQSDSSPTKIARPSIDGAAARLVYDCLLDCFRRIDDFDNLILWLENRQSILRDLKNGTIERFLDPPWTAEGVSFLKTVQEMLINRSSKYKWRTRAVESPSDPDVPGPDEAIKALDECILDARISVPTTPDINERCKHALRQLSDWSQTTHSDFSPHWRVDTVTESLKQSLINDALFLHIGKSLESKSFVLQMSENKIEIDLHVSQLLDQWGASYDFELSNIVKELKEGYVARRGLVLEGVEERGCAIEGLLRERLRGGRASPSPHLLLLDSVCRHLLHDGQAIQVSWVFSFS